MNIKLEALKELYRQEMIKLEGFKEFELEKEKEICNIDPKIIEEIALEIPSDHPERDIMNLKLKAMFESFTKAHDKKFSNSVDYKLQKAFVDKIKIRLEEYGLTPEDHLLSNINFKKKRTNEIEQDKQR